MISRVLHALRPGSRQGSTLYVAIVLMLALGTTMASHFAQGSLSLRTVVADASLTNTGVAAESVVRVMTERLVARAEAKLGQLTTADLTALNRSLFEEPIQLPSGLTLDFDHTDFTVLGTSEDEILPYDIIPLRVVPDHPRTEWAVPPALGGMKASRSIEVQVRATVTGRGSRRGAVQRLMVSKVAPYQFALYTDGDADLCVSQNSALMLGGAVRTEGTLYSWCTGSRMFGGTIQASDGLVAAAGVDQKLRYQGGETELTSATRLTAEASPATMLDSNDGRVVVGKAVGEVVQRTRMQGASVAGTGECRDFDLACGGKGAYFPSVEFEASTQQPGGYELRCGNAYNGQPCTSLRPAVSYMEFPFDAFAGSFSETVARFDPDNPNMIWKGLFPDYRRQAPCTVQVAGIPLQTLRCPSGPYGYTVDVSALPAVPGGLIAFRRSSTYGADRFQEVVLLTNAQQLPGPMTILSELPVFIMGNFNVLSPHPAKIDAPLIAVLPAESRAQLRQSIAWDYPEGGTPKMLKAWTPVTIRAVLRSDYHVTVGQAYYGGSVEQIPAVLGDWSAVTLAVVGAVEGRRVAVGAVGSHSMFHAPYGSEQSQMASVQPAVRKLLYDNLLLQSSYQPPGSWTAQNLPADMGEGLRTRDRQQNAIGGFTVIRLLHEVVQVRRRDPGSRQVQSGS
jgi:hypothetical protein